MALIKCPECGKDVSDRAPACIHCGCPLSEIKNVKIDAIQSSPKSGTENANSMWPVKLFVKVGIIVTAVVVFLLIFLLIGGLIRNGVMNNATQSSVVMELQQIENAVVAEDIANNTFDLSTDTIVKGSTKIGATFDLADYVNNTLGCEGTISCTQDGVVTYTIDGKSATWNIATGAIA